MANLTAILASLILVIAEGAVKGGKFTELVTLKLILPFRNRRSGFNDVVDQLLGFVDLLLGICHD